jgi:hypothetical protein
MGFIQTQLQQVIQANQPMEFYRLQQRLPLVMLPRQIQMHFSIK